MANRKTKNPRTVLVTGASSGIGEALARRFAAQGHALVLVARSADKLDALAGELSAAYGVRVLVQPADLTQPGAAAALAAALRRKRVVVEVLVNNAGVLEQGAFCDIPAERHRQMVELNVAALTAMLAAFLPGMRERGFGRVLNVASIAAFQPVPMLATYAATKAYVLSLTESLSEELKGTGVTVSALCPGVTATPMVAHAADGVRACMGGEVITVPGVVNLAGVLTARATPKWLLRAVSGFFARSQM